MHLCSCVSFLICYFFFILYLYYIHCLLLSLSHLAVFGFITPRVALSAPLIEYHSAEGLAYAQLSSNAHLRAAETPAVKGRLSELLASPSLTVRKNDKGTLDTTVFVVPVTSAADEQRLASALLTPASEDEAASVSALLAVLSPAKESIEHYLADFAEAWLARNTFNTSAVYRQGQAGSLLFSVLMTPGRNKRPSPAHTVELFCASVEFVMNRIGLSVCLFILFLLFIYILCIFSCLLIPACT